MEEGISSGKIIIEQIETAIKLFNEGKYISATTLAGAAEEIIGKRLEFFDEENVLSELAKKYSNPTEVINRANYARNSFKHIDVEKPWSFEMNVRGEAWDMVNRAIGNYWLLKQEMTPLMSEFYGLSVQRF